MRRFLLILLTLGALAPVRLHALAGSVPLGLRANFMFGTQSFPGGAGSRAWMDATKASHNAQWDLRYAYLNAGVNTGWGWETWNSPSGAYASLYMSDSDAGGYIPVFTYYEMLQSTPATGADESAKDYSNLNNTATMAAYYANFKLLMQKCAAFNKPVIVHIEPDLNGYMQKDHSGAPALPQNCPAAVASSGFAEAAGYPNTYQGYNRVLRRLRDLYAPKVILAIHVTLWATSQDLMATTALSQAQLDAEVTKTANFLSACDAGAEGKFDLFFFEASDRDSSYKWIVNGQTWWWWSTTATNIGGSPQTFVRHQYLINSFSNALAKRGMAWQIPVGNSVFKTCNNDAAGYHYRSPYAEYVLGDYAGPGPASHLQGYADAGVVGWLFGAGQNDQTHPWDERGDGITNAANAANGGGPGYGTITATVSDDDGGYLRIFVGRYYTLGAWPLSGALSPTPTGTATPAWSPTRTPTPSPSSTVTVTPTPIAYSLIFEDFEAGPLKYPYTYADSTGSSITQALSAVAPYDGGNSLRSALAVVGGGYAGEGFDSNYANAQGVVDATGCYLVQVAIKTDQPLNFQLQFREAGTAASPVAGGDGELWDSPMQSVAASANWQLLTLSLTAPAWTEDLYSSNGAAGDGVMDLSAMKTCQLNFLPTVAGATVFVDHIAFIPLVPPSPSPTRTQTRTPTPTASASASATGTPSPTASPTPTPSATATRTASPSATPSASASVTGTSSPTGSRTPTRSATATQTASPSASGTATQTASPTRSVSATMTRSASPTQTVSPLASASATPSLSATATLSPTPSATPSASGSASATPSPSPSATATPSRSATPSATLSRTQSASPTLTLSHTASPIASPTASPSLSATATLSPTRSATASATGTASVTATPTPSMTGSATPSATTSFSPGASASPTATLTATSSGSPTVTSTVTATPSATVSRSATASASPSGTSSVSVSPSASPTSASTPALTPTPTGTVTVTATPSATPSATASPTRSATASPVLSGTPTATPLPSATAAPTLSPSPSASPSPSPVPSASPSPSAGPTPPPAGAGAILLLRAWPNPNPRYVHVDYAGRLLSWKLEVYSRAMAKVGVLEGGAGLAAPLRVDLGPLAQEAWASGAYHYRLRLRFEDKELSRAGTWFVYR